MYDKVPIFIAEIASKNLRGALTTVNQLMICTGVSVSFIIGTILIWRTLALTDIVFYPLIVPDVILLNQMYAKPDAWDCSAWVRTYALFLEKRLECFRILKFDIEAERLPKASQRQDKAFIFIP